MHNSRRSLRCLTSVLVVLIGSVATALAEPVTFARHLALSPDGTTLAFCWAGDIWTVPVTGGQARRLTVHPADDTHPVWSPDGKLLAFASDRHGAADVFVMNPDGTDRRRLTFSDRDEIPTDFGPDGRWVYFHSTRAADVYGQPRPYRVPTTGGQSWPLLDCFANHVRSSTDGAHLIMVRGQMRWWRRGYRGSANEDLWVWNRQSNSFCQLTTFDGADRQPAWDGTDAGVYFLSDRGGTVNVWHQSLDGGAPEQISQLSVDDVRDLAVSRDGQVLALTHWDDIYIMPAATRLARRIDVYVAEDTPTNPVDLRTYTNSADESEPAPNGEELALVVRGEILVTRTAKGKPTRQVTHSAARDHDVVWSPDGKALFFVSDQAGQEDIYRVVSAEDPRLPLADSLRFRMERITDSPELEYYPRVSPNGKKLAYLRTRGDLIIRDLKTGQERVLLESWNSPGFRWSPDSKWIAYHVEDLEFNADVWIVPADGSAPAVNISRHPDRDTGPQWSADGQMLAFSSRRAGFDRDIYVVFLAPELGEMSGSERDEYFEEQAKAVKKRKPMKSAVASGKIALAGGTTAQPASAPTSQPTTAPSTAPAGAPSDSADLVANVRTQLRTWLKDLLEEEPATKPRARRPKPDDKPRLEWELETCYKRLRRVTSLPADQANFAMAPDGAMLAFTSSHEGDARLYTIKWDGSERKRILSDGVGALRWSLDGKRLFHLRRGVPRSCSPTGSSVETHGFRARLKIDRLAEADQKFNDAARQLGTRFYHPTMKGLDWVALTDKYRPLALKTHTVAEFNTVFSMLLGELNASHLGIGGPGGGTHEHIGYLGCTIDPTYAGPGLRVQSILPDGPTDRHESRLHPGDILLKVAGTPVGPECALEAALIDTVGTEVIVEYLPAPKHEPPATTSQPTTTSASQPAAASQPTTAPAPVELVIRPTSSGRFSGLTYDAWVATNRRYVEEHSQGRVGYLHIRSMNEPSFNVFERDLYAAAHGKDGLIIDVRNNGGGWTADWILAVLSVQRHAYTVQRGGAPGYPQDRLIFYAWTKPATMMCNEHSFSNAEIVSHAFKNLQRGPLVGMTTYGAVISTGGYRLIDGTHVRMPERGWYTLPAETDMENNGAVPHVIVPVTPEDERAGLRPQLDAAIAATLKQIERSVPPTPAP